MLAIDQTDPAGPEGDPAGPIAPIGAFADAGGTVATWGMVDGVAWKFHHREIDSYGNVRRAEGDDLFGMDAAPVIWKGLRYDAAAGLYRVGTTGVDPTTGR